MPLLFLNLIKDTRSSLFAAEATALKPRTRERLAGSDERTRGVGYGGLESAAEKPKGMERPEV